MADKMAKKKETKAATKEQEEHLIKNKQKVEELIRKVEDLIKEKLGNKTFNKNNPFLVDKEVIPSLPKTLEKFGDNEEKNWIFYGPPGTGKTFALNKLQEYLLCINETNEQKKLLNKVYNNNKKTKKHFYRIINRLIAIPLRIVGIKIYLQCGANLLGDNDKYLVGTPKDSCSAKELFESGNDFEFKRNSKKNLDYKILPTFTFIAHKDDFSIDDTIEKDILSWIVSITNQIIIKKADLIVVAKIVFHPSYTYEDFVGGIKPDLVQIPLKGTPPEPSGPSSPNSLTYKYTRGVMLDLIRKAWEKQTVRYYLIIDEFNRGNIAAIFGEFLYLIENDKRSKDKNSGVDYVFLPGGVYPWDDEKEVAPFSEECKIRMPENIFIVGALNTADRSIATMDFAMRRRFNFVKFEPNEVLITGFKWEKIVDDLTENVKKLFLSLNRSIKYKLDADHEIGHHYFMPLDDAKTNTKNFLVDLFERKIIPLLEAYCDHDGQAVKKVLAITILLFNSNKNDDDIKNMSTDNLKELISKIDITQVKSWDLFYTKLSEKSKNESKKESKELIAVSAMELWEKSLKELCGESEKVLREYLIFLVLISCKK